LGDRHPASIAISLNGRAFRSSVRSLAWPFFQSRDDVVGQPVNTNATVFLDESLFPASLYVSVAGVPAIGLGQPLNPFIGAFPWLSGSPHLFDRGLGHPP
jgi:hypothetical protein